MKNFYLIYSIDDKNKLEEKIIDYIEMLIVDENEFNNLTNQFLYEISAKTKAKNKEEAIKYFKSLYKNAEDVKII